MNRTLALVMLAALATGCSQSPGPATTATAPQNCGAENYGRGVGYNAAARDCLWAAFERKQPATFVTTVLTVEGDPIVKTVKMHAPDRIDVILDTRKDKFGPQRVTTWTCRTMTRMAIGPNQEQRQFRLTGCTGGEGAEMLI
jgi:hypothetical protein